MKQRFTFSALKGTSRRVVIIPCSSDSIFEQILCVVRDEEFTQRGVSAESVLKEAQSLIEYEDIGSRRRSILRTHKIRFWLLIAFIIAAVSILIRILLSP